VTRCEKFMAEWIAERNRLPLEKISLKSHMFDEGYLDSLKAYALILDMEQKFGISFDEASLLDPSIATIEGMCRIIEKLKK